MDANNNGTFDSGETLEPGVKWLGGQYYYVYADGMDNDGDGLTDENMMRELMKPLRTIDTRLTN